MENETGEISLGFLRDNPFIKNDAAHRRLSGVRIRPSATFPVTNKYTLPNVTLKPAWCSPSVEPEPETPQMPSVESRSHSIANNNNNNNHKTIDKSVTLAPNPKDPVDTTSVGSGSDVEYGPGIVERLRAKFNRLSGLASREARVSPHATCKRCPSVDDILSGSQSPVESVSRAYDTLDRNWGDGAVIGNGLSREQSKSVNDVTEEKRKFIVHRQINYSVPDEEDDLIQSISSLRYKFETNASRNNWENRRSEYTAQPPSPRSNSVETRMTSQHVERPQSPPTVVQPPPPVPQHSLPPTTEMAPHVPSVGRRRSGASSAERNQSTHTITSSHRQSDRHSTVVRRDRSYDSPVVSLPNRRPLSMDLSNNEIPPFDKDAPPPKGLRLSEPQQNKLKVLEVLNRTEAEAEPEFVRIGRKLKRSCTADEISMMEHQESGLMSPLSDGRSSVMSPTSPVATPRRPAPSVPTISTSARIIHSRDIHDTVQRSYESPRTITEDSGSVREENYIIKKTGSKQPFDRELVNDPSLVKVNNDSFTSPPDPDSARMDRPALFSPVTSPLPPLLPGEGSPPPEEPTPTEPALPASLSSLPPVILTKHLRAPAPPPPGYLVPKILPSNNDDSGKDEMQRLLSRFNETRDKKMFMEENTEVPNIPEPERKTDPNVAHISVRDHSLHKLKPTDGDQNLIGKADYGKRPAPPPPNHDSLLGQKKTMEQPQPINNHTITRETSIDNHTVMKTTSIDTHTEDTRHKHVEERTKPDKYSTSSRDREEDATRERTTLPPIADYKPAAPRKSLSSKFLEAQKSQAPEPVRQQKPYGDDVTELRSGDCDVISEIGHSNEISLSENDVKPIKMFETVEESSQPCDVKNEEADATVPLTEHDSITIEEETTAVVESKEVQSVTETIEPDEDSEVLDEEAVEYHLKSSAPQELDDRFSEDEEDEASLTDLSLPSSLFSQLPMVGGDGNSIRTSLISLVMEDDLPLLIEAMSENYRFEFVDLTDAQPCTSGILHPPEKRQQRRTLRRVGRISFMEEEPEVYTYLDERTAEREINWTEGSHVSFKTYQRICDEEQAEYKRKQDEIEQWRQSLENSNHRLDSSLDGDCANGLMSSLTEQSRTPDTIISV